MAGREAQRAPVGQSQDPLQMNLTQPETWDLPQVSPSSGLPSGRGGLKSLAIRGSWRAIAQQTANFRRAGPDALLQEAAWQVLALVKLRNFAAAAEELAALGDLDSPDYMADTPEGQRSRVPFALRLLACDIPARLGRWRESQEGFYSLLDFCRREAEAAAAAQVPGGSDSAALWKGREERVAASLFAQHLRLRDYQVALQWLAFLRQRHPNSLDLLSTVGCLQLVIGHTAAAAATFQAVADLVAGKADASKADQHLVRRNRGLLLFAQNDFTGALTEFSAIALASPGDAVAANNVAICHMYSGNLMSAVQALEGSLKAEPLAMLREPLLANLGSMYELCSPTTGPAAKKNLSTWASRIAPDDFDLACLR